MRISFSWFLQLTKNRSKQITKYLNNKCIVIKDSSGEKICKFTADNLTFKHKDNSNCTIDNTFINNLSSDLIKLNKCITDLNKKYWDIKISDIYTTYNSTLKCINKFIADLDCHASNAFTSIKNAYFSRTKFSFFYICSNRNFYILITIGFDI